MAPGYALGGLRDAAERRDVVSGLDPAAIRCRLGLAAHSKRQRIYDGNVRRERTRCAHPSEGDDHDLGPAGLRALAGVWI